MSKPIVVFLGIVIVAFVGFIALKPKEPEVPRLGVQHEDEGRLHINDIRDSHVPYKSDPPTSGTHYREPARWGIVGGELPDEQLIHNMEHGGVIITYQPTLPKEKITELQTIAANLTVNEEKGRKGFKVILVPRSKNTKPIELLAWRYSHSLDTVDKPVIERFYKDHLNHAPEPNAG